MIDSAANSVAEVRLLSWAANYMSITLFPFPRKGKLLSKTCERFAPSATSAGATAVDSGTQSFLVSRGLESNGPTHVRPNRRLQATRMKPRAPEPERYDSVDRRAQDG